jgi:5-methylcytosine-specific restriction protein A
MPFRPVKYRPPRLKRKVDRNRPSSSQRGYDARWHRARKRQLGEHPLCVRCLAGGRSVLATDVDHIAAVEGPLDPQFWDATNWQSLCKACHSRKTIAEDGGFGKRKLT